MREDIRFFKPRLVGKRFENHSIPLEILKDLAILEEMIIEVAKWRYFIDNPSRKRSPRGFTEGISLKLAKIEEGSACPQINISTRNDGLFPPENVKYFEEAKDAIVGAIDAAESDTKISDHLPENLLVFFDRFGRSLREDEVIEFNPDNSEQRSPLKKTTRRKLVLASSIVQDLTEDIILRGSIPEADQKRKTFELEIINGSRVQAPITTQHMATVLEAFNGYDKGLKVSIEGIGRFNRANRLQKIESVEHINLLDPNDIGARIDELRCLKDGWLDGKGIAPSQDGLDWLNKIFDNYYPDDLILPWIYPTDEGKVQAEWSFDTDEITLEIDLLNHKSEWHGLNLETKEDNIYKFNLDSSDGWKQVINKIKLFVGDVE